MYTILDAETLNPVAAFFSRALALKFGDIYHQMKSPGIPFGLYDSVMLRYIKEWK